MNDIGSFQWKVVETADSFCKGLERVGSLRFFLRVILSVLRTSLDDLVGVIFCEQLAVAVLLLS